MTTPTITTMAAGTAPGTLSALVAMPPTLVAGNLIVMILSAGGSILSNLSVSDSSSSSGPFGQWRNVATGNFNMWIRMVDGTEPLNVTISWAGTTTVSYAALQISGAAGGLDSVSVQAALDQVTPASTPATSTNITASTVSPKAADDLLVSVYCCRAATAITLPGSQTSITAGTVSGNSQAINIGYETLSASGATGTRVATIGASTANVGTNFVVKGPSAVGVNINVPYNKSSYPGGPVVAGGASPATIGVIDMGAAISCYWGYYKVQGHTRQAVTLDPLYRKVFLMNKEGNRIIRGLMSVNADGSYVFNYLPLAEYIVMGVDQNNVQNAVVCARITAVAM